MDRMLRLALAAALTLTLATAAKADVIFSNFGAGDAFGNSGRILEGEDVNSTADVDQAASFSVGASSYMLTDVALGIFVRDTPSIGTGPLDILIAEDDGGVPGNVLRTLAKNVNATGKQVLAAADDGSLMLNANSIYWVIADGKDTFDGSWNFNSIGDVGDTAGRTDNGPWNLRPDDDRYALRVEGRLVPEPATLSLLGLGAMGLLALGRRRESLGQGLVARRLRFMPSHARPRSNRGPYERSPFLS
jgi:hypothetical protein